MCGEGAVFGSLRPNLVILAFGGVASTRKKPWVTTDAVILCRHRASTVQIVELEAFSFVCRGPEPQHGRCMRKQTQMEKRAQTAFDHLRKDHKDPYDMQAARMFIFNPDHSIEVISSHQEVYEALENVTNLTDPRLLTMRQLGVETCGWAAPVNETGDNDDTPPSAHPARRRCRLIAVVDRNLEVASCLGFSDTDDLVTDQGNARGALDDAIKQCMAAIIHQQAMKN